MRENLILVVRPGLANFSFFETSAISAVLRRAAAGPVRRRCRVRETHLGLRHSTRPMPRSSGSTSSDAPGSSTSSTPSAEVALRHATAQTQTVATSERVAHVAQPPQRDDAEPTEHGGVPVHLVLGHEGLERGEAPREGRRHPYATGSRLSRTAGRNTHSRFSRISGVVVWSNQIFSHFGGGCLVKPNFSHFGSGCLVEPNFLAFREWLLSPPSSDHASWSDRSDTPSRQGARALGRDRAERTADLVHHGHERRPRVDWSHCSGDLSITTASPPHQPPISTNPFPKTTTLKPVPFFPLFHCVAISGLPRPPPAPSSPQS
eukprot:COSAG04_NODE_915_length_9438_cov_28.362351_2_plen_319_part_00